MSLRLALMIVYFLLMNSKRCNVELFLYWTRTAVNGCFTLIGVVLSWCRKTFVPLHYFSIDYVTILSFLGVFLRKLESGLKGISHVVVDEIHERDINVSVLKPNIWTVEYKPKYATLSCLRADVVPNSWITCTLQGFGSKSARRLLLTEQKRDDVTNICAPRNFVRKASLLCKVVRGYAFDILKYP